MSVTARLYCATLPWPLGLVAAHYWFTVDNGARCDRWEIWQAAGAGVACVGHLHCNLKAPASDVGGGPARVAAEWRGADAARLLETLEKAHEAYPFCHRYRPWPGPNSNTFAAWVLRRANIDFRLPANAIGRNFRWPDN